MEFYNLYPIADSTYSEIYLEEKQKQLKSTQLKNIKNDNQNKRGIEIKQKEEHTRLS